MLTVYLNSVGLISHGLESWDKAISVFNNPLTYSNCLVPQKLASILPVNESRRATRVTKLAMNVAQQIQNSSAALHSNTDELISQCMQIFSSSNGDLSTFHQISQALSMHGRPVSPTRFHNSVHNAPAGYWSIASQSKTASTSITASSDSFSAGILEAVVQLHASDNDQKRDALLICYDEIPPEPFQDQVDISSDFACAFRLSLKPINALAKLELGVSNEALVLSQLSNLDLELLRLSNPQAKALTLLDAIARQQNKEVILPYFEKSLQIRVNYLGRDVLQRTEQVQKEQGFI